MNSTTYSEQVKLSILDIVCRNCVNELSTIDVCTKGVILKIIEDNLVENIQYNQTNIKEIGYIIRKSLAPEIQSIEVSTASTQTEYESNSLESKNMETQTECMGIND